MNDADFTYDTQTEADQGEALAKGAANPERCWISTDRDVWHRNPFFTGVPTPHPEADLDVEELEMPMPAEPFTNDDRVFGPEDDCPF
jgi:hypothetical protein